MSTSPHHSNTNAFSWESPIPANILSDVHTAMHQFYTEMHGYPDFQKKFADAVKYAMYWDVTAPNITVSADMANVTFSRFDAQLFTIAKQVQGTLQVAKQEARQRAGGHAGQIAAEQQFMGNIYRFNHALEQAVGHAMFVQLGQSR